MSRTHCHIETIRNSRSFCRIFGYAIGRAWWGRGLAIEAARAAIAWAVDTFSLVRIWASTDARHVRSRRVLEKLGMQPEAVRVGDHVGRGGELVDEMVYGLNLAPIDNSSP
jgi:ribosomal-protein-alanine N-acetyltransferase